MSKNDSAVMVGGGIGGLATAIGLARNGLKATLVEAAPQFGEVGAGLQLAPNATRILEAWGLMDKVHEIGVVPKRLVIRDAITAEELNSESVEDLTKLYGSTYIVAHRADLHTILLEEARRLGVELLTDVWIEKVEQLDDGAVAIAKDGRRFEGNVVIGADGMKSVVRAQLSDDDVIGSGYVAYRGAIASEEAQGTKEDNDMVIWIGPECHLVQYPLRGGAVQNTVAVFRSPSFERGEEGFGAEEELQNAYSRCTPEVRDALKNLWHGLRWPMYDRLPIEKWSEGRMVLIGDAAHPMLQYLAQGACQAIEDGRMLELLTQGENGTRDWESIIAAFVAERAPRTARVQTVARDWGESWHIDGVGRILRNMLFKARTSKDTHYTDWLYEDVLTPAAEKARSAS